MRTTSLLLALAAVAVAPSTAAAAENTPCTASRAKPQIVLAEKGAGAALYATHDLRLSLAQGPAGEAEVRSIVAPGARLDAEGESGAAALLWVDRPGPLTVTVRAADRDPALDPGSTGADTACTHVLSRTFTIAPAVGAKAGKLRRPRLVDRARRLWHRRVEYSFSVVAKGPKADLSPLTVRVRATRRGRFPGSGTRAVSHLFGRRAFEETEEPRSRGCAQGALICPQYRGSYPKGPTVYAWGRAGGVRVLVAVPTSYPSKVLGRRHIPTPWGVDVEVLQSGRRVARLRAAGRCTQGGQAAKCTFKKASTKP
ncbi:MAG TPA: hypothetical protein VEX39_16650 [Thermoleophilaceae bacterium]|nr:hypothetical protein [Thermoleophilaceae bacterium]